MGKNGYQIIEKAEWGVVLSTKCVICGNVLEGKGLSQAYFALYKGGQRCGDVCYYCAEREEPTRTEFLLARATALEDEAKRLRHLAQHDLGLVEISRKVRLDHEANIEAIV